MPIIRRVPIRVLYLKSKDKDDPSFPLHLNKHNVIRLDVNYEYLICDEKDNFITKFHHG